MDTRLEKTSNLRQGWYKTRILEKSVDECFLFEMAVIDYLCKKSALKCTTLSVMTIWSSGIKRVDL